jgi:hypothetical protein
MCQCDRPEGADIEAEVGAGFGVEIREVEIRVEGGRGVPLTTIWDELYRWL